jgi:Putative phage serine protease XkdF
MSNETFALGKLALYAPILKVDASQRMIWGWASTERKDLQGEIVKSDAIAKALPDYMQWANIREMHRPSAVGKATEAAMRSLPSGGQGLWIGAKIVDDTAWTKIEEGVYKGFSIGGEKLHMTGNEIDEIRVVEISLVDRPANPDCRIEMVKVAGAVDHNKPQSFIDAYRLIRRNPHLLRTNTRELAKGLVGQSVEAANVAKCISAIHAAGASRVIAKGHRGLSKFWPQE